MKRMLIFASAAILAAVPAVLGLVGNASFGESVPVRVPAGATVLADDHGSSDITSTGSTTSRPSTTSRTPTTPAPSTEHPPEYPLDDGSHSEPRTTTAGTAPPPRARTRRRPRR